MDSSTSSSVDKLKKHIDALSEFNFDSSQNVSDLLGSFNFSSMPSSGFCTPTSSPSAKDDESLLNFLPTSDIETFSISPSIDTSDLLKKTPPKSYPKVINSKKGKIKNDEVSAFLTSFNDKYNLKATNLGEVLELIDLLKLDNKPDEIRSIHAEPAMIAEPIIHFQENRNQQRKCVQLQLEKENIKSQLAESNSQVILLQSQLENLKKSNVAIIESNKSLQKDINNLHESMRALHTIIEQQLLDISNLSEQKLKLIETIKKQESIIQIYDSISKQSKLKPSSHQDEQMIQKSNEMKKDMQKKQAKMEENMMNELYTIMCSMVRISDDFLVSNNEKNTSILSQIHQIKDDSDKSPKERIMLIAKLAITSLSKSNDSLKENEELIQNLKTDLAKSHRKCKDILSMYEEELNFLQTLTHSNDLQSAIFTYRNNQPPLILDAQSKAELIRHCAALGRFIEDTIGFISSDSFHNNFDSVELIDSTSIFQLLEKTSMEQKMTSILNTIDDQENIENRQLLDLLAAQIFMNDLIKNYAIELQHRVNQNGHDIMSLRQEIERKNKVNSEIIESDRPCNDELEKIVKRYQKRESKLRQFLSQYVEIDNQKNVITTTMALIVHLSDQLRSQFFSSTQINQSNADFQTKEQEIEKCRKEIQELEKIISEGAKVQKINQEYQAQLDAFQTKIKEVQTQADTWKSEVDNLKTTLLEKEKTLSQLTEENIAKKNEYELSLQETNRKLDSSISTIKSLTQDLQQYQDILSRVRSERPKMKKEIDRLKNLNQNLNNKISTLNKEIKTQYEPKIADLSDKVEKHQSEIDAKQHEIDMLVSKNEQFQAEISTLTLEKRSTALKLQAVDKHIEIEKQSLTTQFMAKINSIQVENDQIQNNFKSIIENAIDSLCHFLTEDVSFSNQEPIGDNLKNAISLVSKEIEKLKNTQSLYVDLLDDVSYAQKLLNVAVGSKISDSVKKLIEANAEHTNNNLDYQKKTKQDKLEIEKLKKTVSKFENQCASLKHWENWAKRLYRVIHEADTRQLNSNELRLNLEEALLSSVSHRSTLLKIESLRSQKMALMKYDNNVLFNQKQSLASKNQNRVISLQPLIALTIFIRRSQILARCLPITIPKEY